MGLSEFLISYRKEHGLSQRQFALHCGLSNGYISMLEKGENPKTGLPVEPTLAAYKKLAEGVGLPLDAFFRTIGETQWLPPEERPEPSEPELRVLSSEPNRVPLIGTIACGRPILAVEDATESIAVPDFVRAEFALRCKGDSMINARIFDGDVVYIRRQDSVENGDIAAVIVGEEATLKKVYYQPGERLILRACNPMYSDLEYFGPELNSVKILGRAVFFLSAVRG